MIYVEENEFKWLLIVVCRCTVDVGGTEGYARR